MTRTLRIGTIADLIPVVPHQFGFHPSASLVVMLLDGRRLAGAFRVDEIAVSAADGLRACLEAARRRSGARSCVVMAYRCTPGVVDLEAIVEVCAAVLPVEHALAVSDGMWWASHCEPGCCDGAVHPVDAASCAQAAARFAGRTQPAVDRDAALADLRRVSSGESEIVAGLLGEARHPLDPARVRQAWKRALRVSASHTLTAGPVGERYPLEDLAVLTEAFEDATLRDQLVWTLAPELGCGPDRPGPLWSAPVPSSALVLLVAAVPPSRRVYWHSLIGFARWREGDSIGAVLAAQEALDLDPERNLPNLLLQLASSGLSYEGFAQRSRR